MFLLELVPPLTVVTLTSQVSLPSGESIGTVNEPLMEVVEMDDKVGVRLVLWLSNQDWLKRLTVVLPGPVWKLVPVRVNAMVLDRVVFA